jgi:hypothetical protein
METGGDVAAILAEAYEGGDRGGGDRLEDLLDLAGPVVPHEHVRGAFVSLGTRFEAVDTNATNRPSAL